MGLLDSAFERTTSGLGGKPAEIPRHTLVLHVPPGVAAPGVFVDAEGAEVGFWLTLQSLTHAQELAILQKAMPDARSKKIKVDSTSEMIRSTIWLFHESSPPDDPGVELTRAKREWLWQVLAQRGRNLVSAAYDRLTEPDTTDAEGNG